MDKKHNVFISHQGVDDDLVQKLKERIQDKGYDIRNGSIDSTKHEDTIPSIPEIEEKLKSRISWAGTFICLIGETTHESEWVNFEIEQAHLMGKRIVGIYAHGCKDDVEIPDALKTYGGAILGWNSLEKLGDTIEGKESPFEKPDSSPCIPIYTITRVKC